jgi:hypothetical protein
MVALVPMLWMVKVNTVPEESLRNCACGRTEAFAAKGAATADPAVSTKTNIATIMAIKPRRRDTRIIPSLVTVRVRR